MPKFELNKISIIDPTDLTDTVTFSTILEGSDGATRAFVEDSAEGYTTEDNQLIEDTLTYAFSALGVRGSSGDESELAGYGNTDLTIAGYAYNKFFQMDDVKLRFRHKGKERRSWMLNATKTGGTGYDTNGKRFPPVLMSANGFNMYEWDEGSTSGVAAGWTKSGGTTVWDSGNAEQDFSTSGATTLYFYRDMYVPHLAGKTVYFSVDVTAFSESTNVDLGIVAYDSSGSTIGSESTYDVDATGENGVSRALPSNVHTIRTRVIIGQNDSISFKNPALNIGTTRTYL